MDLIDRHKDDYRGQDYDRQVRLQDKGLHGHEEYYIDKYLVSKLRTLEVGTGGGRLCFGLERLKGFSSVTGIDFVKELISLALERKRECGSQTQFEVGNILDLPYEGDSYDQVIAFGVVLSHLPKRELRLRALSELFRILKPGGILLINVHNINRYHWLILVRLLMWCLRFGGVFNREGYGPGDIPRLGGQSGRPDLLFWRPGKSTLHYYNAGEIVFDLLHTGFNILEMNQSAVNARTSDKEFYFFRREYISIAAERRD